jgi:hypothetical protein
VPVSIEATAIAVQRIERVVITMTITVKNVDQEESFLSLYGNGSME